MSRENQSLQEIESSLKENFKLSSYEARAYLSLLRLGRQNSKQLASSATVPLPRIYDTIESLMSKGFIIKQDDNFLALPPRQALNGRARQFEVQFSEEQKIRRDAEQRLTSMLEQAYSQSEDSSPSEISVLKGFNTIANKFAELLENSHEVILVAKRAVEAREVFIPIILEFANRDPGRKRIRIIAPKGVKITKEDLAQAKKANAEIRKSDNVMFDMMITDLDDVIIGVPDPLSEEINHAIAIWVRNNSFASSTKISIEETWAAAEKV